MLFRLHDMIFSWFLCEEVDVQEGRGSVADAAEDGGDSLLQVVRSDDVWSSPGTKETFQELVLDPLCCLLHHTRPELLTVSEAFLSLETVFQRGQRLALHVIDCRIFNYHFIKTTRMNGNAFNFVVHLSKCL